MRRIRQCVVGNYQCVDSWAPALEYVDRVRSDGPTDRCSLLAPCLPHELLQTHDVGDPQDAAVTTKQADGA